MRSVLCCLVILVSVALGAQFTCNVEYRNALMKNGFVRGTLAYSSDLPGRMQYKYDKTAARDEVVELYEFNGFNGMNGKNPLPYQNQLSFTTGSSCACETGYMDYAMPILHVDASNQGIFDSVYQSTGAKSATGCDIYKRREPKDFVKNDDYNTYDLGKITFTVTELHLDSNKMPCYAELTNGKKYSYSNCARANIASSTFAEPKGCKCGKPLDIAIVLDRSGSISVNEFRDEKGFIEDFASQFTYGPLEVNLAIVNFRAKAYLDQGLELTKGITKANVDAAVATLGCPKSCDDTNKNCNGNAGACCCCCGTCIACGMKMGAEQLAKGRSFAFKLLIVLTDGYGNTLVNGGSCGNDDVKCNGALQEQVDYLHSLVGGPSKVATYAIGVGSDRDVSNGQLLVIAGNNPDRVLRRADFAELANNNVELIARACDENPNPCGGCCGFCSCGKCQAVDGCLPSSPCNPAAVPPAGVCCADVPTQCTAKHEEDPCNFYDCDDNSTSTTAGQCVVTSSIECGAPANTTCFTRECVKETGLCATTPKCAGVTECVDASGCDDKNLCTNDVCNPDGGCEWTSVNCSLTHTPNKCQILRCTPDKGCHFDQIPDSSCDDNNNCTIDFCDPEVGCSHTDVTCKDDDACTHNLCDPINGCMFVPVVCESNETNPCALTFCEPENGTCAFRALDCTYAFPQEIIVGTLTAAAIVGIVIAAVLCAAGVAGGGAYAYANAGAGGNASAVSNNPLYVGSGFSGSNPLARN